MRSLSAFHGGYRAVLLSVGLIALTVLSGCGSSSSVPPPAARQEVSVAGLKAMLADGDDLQILDVRPVEAFADLHIPGSINVAPEQVAAWGVGIDRDARVCCVSDTGKQSAQSADVLVAQGHRRVYNLTPGLDEWDGAVEPPPSRHDITADALKAMLADGRPLVILDVGTAYSYSYRHIPGSVNVPLEELGTWATAGPRQRRICVGCT